MYHPNTSSTNYLIIVLFLLEIQLLSRNLLIITGLSKIQLKILHLDGKENTKRLMLRYLYIYITRTCISFSLNSSLLWILSLGCGRRLFGSCNRFETKQRTESSCFEYGFYEAARRRYISYNPFAFVFYISLFFSILSQLSFQI